jgi:hypothetical protein
MAFAAHQAKVLGGPAFKEDESSPHAFSSKEDHQHPPPKRPFSSRFRSSRPKRPEAPLPPTPPRVKHESSAPPLSVDRSTRHHIRDPHLGELEVKEIGIGDKSSIPPNILANLLRVTTGDELIEFD